MADEKKFADEILSDEELDNVAGGNIGDRTMACLWIQHYYGQDGGTHGQLIDTSSNDPDAIMNSFCAKAGIEHIANEVGSDLYKINGEWRDVNWLIENKQEALNFFDKSFGIK